MWVVSREMLPRLVVAAMQDDLANHPWWKHGDVNRVVGEFKVCTSVFPPEWNAYGDATGKFWHACGINSPAEKAAAIGSRM